MCLLSILAFLNFAVAEVGGGDATAPVSSRPDAIKSESQMPQILRELHREEIPLKQSSGADCPKGNFLVKGDSGGYTVTIYDRLENGFFYGNGLVHSIGDGRHEFSTVKRTPDGKSLICNTVVTKESQVRSNLRVLSTTLTEETCDGVKKVKRETFEVVKNRGGRLAVNYKEEVQNSSGRNGKWEVAQTCNYGKRTIDRK